MDRQVTQMDLKRFVDALERADDATPPVHALPKLFGVEPDDLAAILDALEAAGLIDRWPGDDDDDRVVISAAEMGRREIELAERGAPGRYYWVDRDNSEHPHLPRRRRTDSDPRPKKLVPITDLTARGEPVRLDYAEGESLNQGEFQGAVRNIYGTGPAWPLPAPTAEHCPGCSGCWVREDSACVVCNRIAGIDPPDSAPVPDRPAPRSTQRFVAPDARDVRILELKRLGWTDARIAEEVGLSQSAVSRRLDRAHRYYRDRFGV